MLVQFYEENPGLCAPPPLAALRLARYGGWQPLLLLRSGLKRTTGEQPAKAIRPSRGMQE